MKTVCFKYPDQNICEVNFFLDVDYDNIKNVITDNMNFTDYVFIMKKNKGRVFGPINNMGTNFLKQPYYKHHGDFIRLHKIITDLKVI